jgi:hypothetical protein
LPPAARAAAAESGCGTSVRSVFQATPETKEQRWKLRASPFGNAPRGETDIDSTNGQGHEDTAAAEDGVLELRDVLVIETTDGKQLEFEVVGLVEDDENHAFAVCYSEKADEFVVTDAVGTLLDDDELAQEILDDFFVLADESSPESQA